MDRVSVRDDEVIGLRAHIRARRLAVMGAIVREGGGVAKVADIRRATRQVTGKHPSSRWISADLAHLRWYGLVEHPFPHDRLWWRLTARGIAALARSLPSDPAP